MSLDKIAPKIIVTLTGSTTSLSDFCQRIPSSLSFSWLAKSFLRKKIKDSLWDMNGFCFTSAKDDAPKFQGIRSSSSWYWNHRCQSHSAERTLNAVSPTCVVCLTQILALKKQTQKAGIPEVSDGYHPSMMSVGLCSTFVSFDSPRKTFVVAIFSNYRYLFYRVVSVHFLSNKK